MLVNTFRILQIADVEKCDYAFRSQPEKARLNDYEVVFCDTAVGNTYDRVEDFLEEIFTTFNSDLITRTAHMRSVSVSDIVVVNDTELYFCANFGWTKIDRAKFFGK